MMVDPATAQTHPEAPVRDCEPAADAAEPPGRRRSLRGRLRRSPLGVAALLPALVLAAAFVAAPFSGSVSQRVDQPSVTAPATAPLTAHPVTHPTAQSTPSGPAPSSTPGR